VSPAMVYTGIYCNAPYPGHKIAPAFVLVYCIKNFQHDIVIHSGGLVQVGGIPHTQLHHTGIANAIQLFLALRIMLFTTFYDIIPLYHKENGF
jgi:hypothetical protein